MKKVLLLLCFVLLFSNDVSAYTQMNDQAIERAQEYGIMNYQKDIHDFAKAWVTYEEQSKSLDTSGERAYVYTPYYLVAINARERLLAGQPINPEDGRIVINAFKGALPINIVLHLENVENIKDDLIAILQQKNSSVEAYAVEIQHIKVIKTKTIKVLVKPESNIETGIIKLPDDKKDNEEDKTDKIDSTDKKEDNKDKATDKDKKDNKKDKKKKKDKDKEKEKEKEKKELYKKDDKDKAQSDKKSGADKPEVKKEPEAVYVDETVPALYQVQLFCCFDSRNISLNGQWVLLIDTPNERERRFNFSFSDMQ